MSNISNGSQRSYVDFPREEYEQRYVRARLLMDEQNLDALLITERSNFIYFTGHRSPESPVEKGMMCCWVCIFPKTGRPVVIVPSFDVNFVMHRTWISDVRVGSQILRHPIDSPGLTHVESIVQTVRDMGLGDSNIGCELGSDQLLGICYNDFVDMKRLLPTARLVDASGLLNSLLSIKSEYEVNMCRKAAQIAARSIEQIFGEIHEGMTGNEVAKATISRMISEGAGDVNLIIMNGMDLTREPGISPPTDKPLMRGETLILDAQAMYKGYWCDIARTAVVGEASERQKRLYERVRRNQKKCYTALRPGLTADELVHFCMKVHESGIDPAYVADRKIHVSGTYGGVCHGIGLFPVQYPFLALGQKVVMKPGMTLAFNPSFTTPFLSVALEENVVITNEGHEIISTPESATELPVV
jgi:Xaa-Pro aminopeptidase